MPYKLSVWILIFLVSFNGGAELLVQTGTADYMGISADVGDTSELESAQNTQSFQSGTGTGSTLFGTYQRVTQLFNDLFNAIMPGAEMLKAAIPSPTWHTIVNFVFSVLALFPVIDAAKYLRGL